MALPAGFEPATFRLTAGCYKPLNNRSFFTHHNSVVFEKLFLQFETIK